MIINLLLVKYSIEPYQKCCMDEETKASSGFNNEFKTTWPIGGKAGIQTQAVCA